MWCILVSLLIIKLPVKLEMQWWWREMKQYGFSRIRVCGVYHPAGVFWRCCRIMMTCYAHDFLLRFPLFHFLQGAVPASCRGSIADSGKETRKRVTAVNASGATVFILLSVFLLFFFSVLVYASFFVMLAYISPTLSLTF